MHRGGHAVTFASHRCQNRLIQGPLLTVLTVGAAPTDSLLPDRPGKQGW